jgi:hypothetical protein
MKAITYQSPAGNLLSVCESCEKDLEGNWPKDNTGQEYCTVSHGVHEVCQCDVCGVEDEHYTEFEEVTCFCCGEVVSINWGDVCPDCFYR